MAKIGENLKSVRKKHNLTQQELAEFLSTSNSMVSKLETELKPNIFINYLYFCRTKGEDLNKIFDDDFYKEFIKEHKKIKK